MKMKAMKKSLSPELVHGERGDELSAVIERERTRSVVETRKIASLLRKAREKSVAPENN